MASEIAIAVVVENTGGGGSVAAPVARKVLDAYFAQRKPDTAPKAGDTAQPDSPQRPPGSNP
jgi:penicillin-binding protein 2